jgi:hypothetical protein
MEKRFARDNIAGHRGGWLLRFLLLPGTIVQWLWYVFPKGSSREVRALTRKARSPLYTVIISTGFWTLLLIWSLGYL